MPMDALSLVLVVFVGLALIALLYEFAAEHRRTEMRARYKRQIERINTPAPLRTNLRSGHGR